MLLKKFRGTHFIVDRVRKGFYRAGRARIEDFDGDIRMEVDLSEHMGSRLFWFGFYSRDVTRLLDAKLAKDDVFIDLGANIGEVSLFAAKRAAQVYSFEPMPKIAAAFLANLALNDFSNVELIEQGVSDSPGKAAIFIQSGEGGGSHHDGLGTLFAMDSRNEPGGVISLTTLDDFVSERGLSRLNGIKLDIEGAELAAIRGGRRVLQRFRPWLIVEVGRDTCRAAGYEPEELLSEIESFGYRGAVIGPRGDLRPLRELAGWQNMFFTAIA